ncbi:MAG: exosome complex protein Rrp42 [Methanomicrobia archaeon]|nr:exosome complex protein Rrp42 [Methanomicrobia archaeon]
MTEIDLISNIEKDYILNLAKKGEREDGRDFDEHRKLILEPDLIKKAEGSCLVSLGETKVLAGIKVDKGEPYPDTPDQAVMTTNAELVPLASPFFESGPPDEDSIELARVVDRGIREAPALDMSSLVVREGELVRVIFIDLHILDSDGNLFDASNIAAVTALHTTKIPVLDDEGNPTEDMIPLPVIKTPVSCTFAKIGDNIVVDPSLNEERVLDARLTVTTEDNGYVCAMQKGGNSEFTVDEIMDCIKKSIKIGKEIRKTILKTTGKQKV